MNEKRTETRFRSRGEFCIVTDDGQRIQAKLVDTSPSGLGLNAESAVDAGSAILLENSGIEVAAGVVQHCSPDGARFFLGIALSDPGV